MYFLFQVRETIYFKQFLINILCSDAKISSDDKKSFL